MKKYKTGNYDITIQEFEVVKETAHRITFKRESKNWQTGAAETRIDTENKSSNYHQWHDTYEAAKHHLLETSESKISLYQSRIEQENLKIIQIKSL